MVNGLMGHVRKVGLKYAAFHLKINLMHLIPACRELNFQGVLLQVLNVDELVLSSNMSMLRRPKGKLTRDI